MISCSLHTVVGDTEINS